MRRMKRRLGLAGVRVGEAEHPGPPPFKFSREELAWGLEQCNKTKKECDRLFEKVKDLTNAPQKSRARGSC